MLEVRELNGNYILTVPISQLTMSFPKEGLIRSYHQQEGSQKNPRYFFFEDTTRHLIISGWFESSENFTGAKEAWATDTLSWKENGLPDPLNVSFDTVSQWDVVCYDEILTKQNNSHLRAHWVQSGTWIDIHLSLQSYDTNADQRKKLTDFLKSIRVKEKPKKETVS